MFCWACGSEVSDGLRFCNRCGASLTAEAEGKPRHRGIIVILSLAVAAVTIAGLLFMLILGTEMLGRRDSTAESYIFLGVIFLTVLASDALMVRQISRLLTAYLESGDAQNQPRTKDRGILTTSAPGQATPPDVETMPLNHDTRDAQKRELPTRKL